MNLQSLTESDVRNLADSLQIFYRGKEYYESGEITQFSLTPHQIAAKVRGNYGLYKIDIDDSSGELESECTCPYDGWVCKHIVAVLLRYLRGEDEMPQPNESGSADVLEQALSALSHHELLQLVLTLAREQADVRRSLLANVPITPQILHQQPQNPGKVKTLKRQISEFFNEFQHRSEYDDYYYDREYDEDETYSELDTAFEEAKTLNPVDQLEVFWHAITAGDELFEEYPIGTEQIEDAIRLYAEAVQKLGLSHSDKQAHLNSLLSVLDFQVSGYGDVVKAVKRGLDTICTEPDDYRYLIAELEESDRDDSTDWIADFYLKLGDEASYLRVRQENLHTEAQYLELAEYWQQKGDRAQYLATLEAGASFLVNGIRDLEAERRHNYPDGYEFGYYRQQSPLLQILAADYRQQSDEANLCRVLMITAEVCGVTLVLYQEIEGVATRLGQWQELRPTLLKRAKSNIQELARIHLHEQNWQAAIDLARSKSAHYDSIQTLVAEGVKQHRPQDALQLYDELVQANIDQKSRKYYSMAAGHARAMKSIYLSILKDDAAWRAYVGEIRDRYRRYPALQDEFARL